MLPQINLHFLFRYPCRDTILRKLRKRRGSITETEGGDCEIKERERRGGKRERGGGGREREEGGKERGRREIVR